MRKILALLILVFCTTFGFISSIHADDVNEDDHYVQVFPAVNAQTQKVQIPNINASAAIVMDAKSGRVLYEKNAYTKRAMASTTKIMTAIVAIENGKLDDIVTVSKRAAGIGGSEINLTVGEKLTLKELLYGLMVRSGNDASIAIAEHIGGSVENFCEMMNKKALELGAGNTHFTSPHGLDNPEHYTTPYELAKITQYALKNPLFSKIVATQDTTITNRGLHNTNELLGVYPGANGVKTGYTGQAGRCLVTSATRNNFQIISVVLGSPTRTARAQSSKSILDYAYNNYTPQTLLKAGESMGYLPVIKGICADVDVKAVADIKLPLTKNELDTLQKDIYLKESLNAPVYSNVEVGSIRFMINDKVIAESPIVTNQEVRRKTFTDYLYDIIYEWGKIVR